MHEAVGATAEPLPLLPAVALAGGVALFFAADVGYRWRDHHQPATHRLVAALGAAAVIPLAMYAPALTALAAQTVVCVLETV